jgi:hypothetical protein
VKESWEETACLYITLVVLPGQKNSSTCLLSLTNKEKDSKSFLEYKREKSEYDNNLQLSKEDRKVNLKKPHWQKMLVSDVTPEALAEVHFHNLRGLGSLTDELASWFKNFDRYHKGSEEQFWLSNWSNKPIRIDRKTGEPLLSESHLSCWRNYSAWSYKRTR